MENYINIAKTKKNTNLLEIEHILKIFQDICQGMLYLLSKNHVHGDLKTANIMTNHKNDWKLIDYDYPVSGLIGNFIIGTKSYISPEYKKYFKDKNPPELTLKDKLENDVWSLGVILYRMIYLDFPYFSKQKIIDYPIDPEILFLKGFNIQENAKDLLLRIFTDPSNRISLKEIMNHKFLKEIPIVQLEDKPLLELKKKSDIQNIPLSEKPFSSLKIVWFDPNIQNEENTVYLVKYSEKFHLEAFKDCQDAIKFLVLKNIGLSLLQEVRPKNYCP